MRHRQSSCLPLLVLLCGCAEGGDEDRPQSEVAITATHHQFGFRSLRGFGTFPVPASVVNTDRGVLNLFDNSTYTVTRSSGTSSAQRYALEADGALSLFLQGSGNEPSVVFRGGYSLVGTNPDYFFTDRVTTPGSPSIGLFFGTRIQNGVVELEGGWHVLSLHAVFGTTLLSPDNVGRGARGGVSIAAGAPGVARVISGTGNQGTSGLVFGGTIQNLLDGAGTGNGQCNLTISYQLSGQTADTRNMQSAATGNLVFGLDDDESDGEAGLLAMVRKFDAPAAPVDSVRVPGTYLVGGHTLFVNPSNSGSDTFVGTITLTAQSGFRLDAVGSAGQDFSYVGSYTLAGDGGITISVNGTNESWFAAIDRSYNTLVFVDDFVETRANGTPELNFGFAVRRKPE